MQLALVAFWIVVPSLIEALLLRAAVASSNRFWRSSYPLREPAFRATLTTMLVANILGAVAGPYLFSDLTPWRQLLIAITVKWLVVGVWLVDEYRVSIDRVLVVIGLLILYFFLLSLVFVIPYALTNY